MAPALMLDDDEIRKRQWSDDDESVIRQVSIAKKPKTIIIPKIKDASAIPSTTVLNTANAATEHRCTFPGCDKTFKKKSKLDQHSLSHTDERPFACHVAGCDKRYRRQAHLAVHSLTHEVLPELRKPFICPKEGCMSSFATKHHLTRHERTHETPKPHVCDRGGCTETFAKAFQLRRHICEHDGKLPYPCEHQNCDKSFPTPSKLKAHAQTHAEISRYACGHGGCLQTFTKWSALQSHIRQEHKNECPSCEKTFARKDVLKAHMKTHDQDREIFPCTWPDCPKSFSSPQNRTVHVKAVHEQIKPYTCDFDGCGAEYAHKHLLSRHKRLHDPLYKAEPKKKRKDALPEPSILDQLTGHDTVELTGRTITCWVDGCDRRFRRDDHLTRHLETVHEDEWEAWLIAHVGIGTNESLDDEGMDLVSDECATNDNLVREPAMDESLGEDNFDMMKDDLHSYAEHILA
ncbi:hypothetical protein HDU76_011259 [Blyttiomyces sp. JEL0837]|nr:hypothetical protein HDU76_011259 [Blyttiomyces sp. JEL0837]